MFMNLNGNLNMLGCHSGTGRPSQAFCATSCGARLAAKCRQRVHPSSRCSTVWQQHIAEISRKLAQTSSNVSCCSQAALLAAKQTDF